MVVDTSDLPLPEAAPDDHAASAWKRAGMGVSVLSFAFPAASRRRPWCSTCCAIRIMSMRCGLTGRDAAVAAYIEADPDFAPFWRCMTDMMRPLLPRYAQEGRSTHRARLHRRETPIGPGGTLGTPSSIQWLAGGISPPELAARDARTRDMPRRRSRPVRAAPATKRGGRP
jgi:hypothetical protein